MSSIGGNRCRIGPAEDNRFSRPDLAAQAFIEAVLCVLSEIFLIVHLPSISGASIDCNLIFLPPTPMVSTSMTQLMRSPQ